jgi:hypothetical protein
MLDEKMSFAEYANSPMFSQLADIRNFRLIADIPPIGAWADDTFTSRLGYRIYEHLREVIKAARFFYVDELKPIKGVDQVIVQYLDDRYDFNVVCSEGNISIQRRGSRLSNFHTWYMSLMPSANGILSHISSALSDMLNRNIDFMRASFRFSFLIYDITSFSTNRPVKNSEIMRKLLSGYPDEGGVITESADVLPRMGRVDVAMTRWIGVEDRRRLLRFSVEAPANMGWSSLWFTFEYRGESYTSPDNNTRETFDPNVFLAEYDRAYINFLRDAAINGFMQWLMRGYSFRSTAGELP